MKTKNCLNCTHSYYEDLYYELCCGINKEYIGETHAKERAKECNYYEEDMCELKICELETNNTELEVIKTNLYLYGETLYILKSRHKISDISNTRFGNITQILAILRKYKGAIVKYVEPSQSAFIEWLKPQRGFKL